MVSSATISLLYKVSLLAERYGLRPSEADAILIDREESDGCYDLTFMGSPQKDHQDGFIKMMESLGVLKTGVLRKSDFSELEDAVEMAFSKAPRARIR